MIVSTSKICSRGLGEVCSLSKYGNSSAMVKFLKWRALYKLGCCLSRLVSRVTSLRLARFPSATRNITLLPYVFSVNYFSGSVDYSCRFTSCF